MKVDKFIEKGLEHIMNLGKIFKIKDYIESELTFEEICKMFREIFYSKISYYDENNKGIIYNGEYSDINIEQATRIQQRLREDIALFEQIMSDKREFDEIYLRSKGL